MINQIITFIKATVVTGRLMDRVILKTTLPPTTPLSVDDAPADFLIFATKGFGEEYVRKNFPGVQIEVVQT